MKPSTSLRLLGSTLATLLVLSAAPGIAHARLLELYAQAMGGGMDGGGLLASQSAVDDFFRSESGGAFGGEVGAEILYTDLFVDHTQYVGQSGLKGSWTQFMLGWDYDWPWDNKGRWTGFLGIDGGFGVGTPIRVHPPLDNSQVSWKGFVAEFRFGADYRLGGPLSMGFELLPAAHYLFRNQQSANDQQNQKLGVQGAALVTLKVDWALR